MTDTVRQMQINATPLALADSPREIQRMAWSLNGDRSGPDNKKVFSICG